jgi:hypothetical protein
MTEQNLAPKSYEELEESLFPKQAKPSSIDLTSLANTVFAMKKYSDITSVAALGLIFLSGGEAGIGLLSILFLAAPLASAALGVAATVIAGKRSAITGTPRTADSQDIVSYKQAFKDAAGSLQAKQIASALLIGASPFMMGLSVIGMFSGNTAMAMLFPLSAVAAAVGGLFGWGAKKENTKMNVYEIAIGKEQLKLASPAP